jgi:NADPH:quinone reductase-like Zn-dependent oxidoreductase
VNPVEWYGMTGLFIARLGGGLFRPKDIRLGVDYSGIVETVGKNVTDFKPGDEVYGARSGAFAEYVCVKNHIYAKPANITFEQAGSVGVAAMTALQGLRDHGKLQAGQKVLINGASGGVGTYAVQIAKALGAEVSAVCSPRNVELVRSLGADHVIDYTKEDFTRNGQRYDLLLDIAGSRPWREVRRVLQPDAHYVIVGAPKGNKVIGPLGFIIKTRLSALRASQTIVFFVAKFEREDFLLLNDWFASGKVKPFVEKTYPLKKIADAMHHLGTGHAKGKIVVTIN